MTSRTSSAKSLEIKYPICTDPTHNKQAMNLVCFDSCCKNQGLMCSICKTSSHQKHQTLPLKMFLKVFQDFQKTQTLNNTDKVLQQINAMHQNVLVTLRQTVQKLAAAIRDFEIQLIKSYKQIIDELVDQSNNHKRIIHSVSQIKKAKTDDIVLNVAHLLSSIKYDSKKKKIQICNSNQRYLAQYTLKQFNYIEIIKQLKFNAMTVLDTAKNETKREKITQPIFKFNENLKPNIIKLAQNNTQARQSQSSNGDVRFALIEPPLPLDKMSDITFRVKNRANWIGVGICIKPLVLQKKFKFTYSSIGHGSFLLSTNGYTWSHSRSEDNIKLNAFSFDTGTNVKVTFDPLNSKIIYKNMQNQKTYEQFIDLTQQQKIKGISFCANLCSCGDQIKIINHKKI